VHEKSSVVKDFSPKMLYEISARSIAKSSCKVSPFSTQSHERNPDRIDLSVLSPLIACRIPEADAEIRIFYEAFSVLSNELKRSCNIPRISRISKVISIVRRWIAPQIRGGSPKVNRQL
jgi:hypothetical protein